MSRFVRTFVFALVAMSVLLAACAPAATPTATAVFPIQAPTATLVPTAVPLSGDIAVDGSSTVFPITEAMAEEFGITNPDVRVAVGISGTGGGFKKFCNNETDIQDASRPIKASEQELCAANGIEYVEFLVGLDGLTVAVNPANDFAVCLNVEQLKAMWDQDSAVNN